MRRVVAIFSAALIGLAVPAGAFAQTAGSGQNNSQAATAPVDQSGLTAFGQDTQNQTTDNTAFLVAGGLAIGGGVLIGVLATNNKSNNETTNPASP